MQFCQQYNAATENQRGQVIPVEITIYDDRSFTFVLKTPPTTKLILEAAGLAKGASLVGKDVAGSITQEQVRKIAETKMPDINALDIDAAMAQVAGTARSMGIKVNS